MASRRRRGLQTMLAMLRERKTSHQQLASSVLHRRAEELRTTKHLPWNVGRQGAHSPTRRATASAKRRTRSSTPGRRSGLSLEAGTPVLGLFLPGVLQVIGPKRVELGSCASTDSTRRPIPPRILWCCFCRLGSATDAFLLKIIVEERLGYPVQLISDGLIRSIESALNLTGPASVYAALAIGTADIYPEVCRVACVRACVSCM